MTCYYIILGISPLASADDIRKAYRKLSMKHHPDRVMSANKAKATDKMAEINQANDVLSDAKKRMYYDQTGCIP
jgi:curved DNA-binding protein CbpA